MSRKTRGWLVYATVGILLGVGLIRDPARTAGILIGLLLASLAIPHVARWIRSGPAMTRLWPPLLALFTLLVGGAGGYGFAVLRHEPPPAESCGGVQRMVRLQLSPATEALLERRRGDRWVVFEAREVARPRPGVTPQLQQQEPNAGTGP